MKKIKLLLTILTMLIAIFVINIGVSAASNCENHSDTDSNTFCDVCNEYLSELIETGRCGDSVNYNWYSDGTVIISGEGPMWDCVNGRISPFYTFGKPKSISKIIIENNVTAIGFACFVRCNAKTIILSKDIKTIREAAFQESNLKNIYFSGSAEEWKNVSIETRNENFTNLSVNYNYCLSSKSTEHKNKVVYTQQNATCTNIGFTEGTYCSDCEIWLSGHHIIPTIEHSYEEVISPATYTANGKTETICSECGDVKSSKKIAKVTSATLSKENYVYDGKNKTPKVTVKDANGKQLVKNVDYKTSIASSRSNIGKYYVKVTLIGNYEGEKKVYFYIRPGVPTKLTATQSTSYIKLSWDKAPGAAGYSVYRYDKATDSYKKLKATTALTYTDKDVKAGTKYTYKVVPYGRSKANNVYYSKGNIIIETATKTSTPSITVTSSSKTKALVKWNNVSGESGYQVWYSTSKDGTYKRFGNAKANATSLTVTGLTNGKTYYFKVRTYTKTDSGYVYSSWSPVKSVTLTTSYYITKTGTKYHIDGCSSLSKSKIEISYKDAVAKGYKACDKCIG